MSLASLPQEIAHLPGCVMLLLSFLLLRQRREAAAIKALAAQGVMLALAAALQGWVQGAPQLLLVALIEVAGKLVLLPMALWALLRRSGPQPAAERAGDSGPHLIAGIALVALAVLLVQPITGPGQAVAREDLALSLAILLLGLLLMATRRGAIQRVSGLAGLENGAILAAVSAGGMPLLPALSLAGLALTGVVLAGAFLHRVPRLAHGGERG